MPVFVISLATAHERRVRMRDRLDRLKVKAEFVDAIDGVRFVRSREETSRLLPHLGRALTAGEVACLESHCRVLERIATGTAASACVLEDDAVPSDAWPAVLRYLAEQPVLDLVLLGHHSARRSPALGALTTYRTRPLGDGIKVGQLAEFAMGAYAYVVTRRAADALRRQALPPRMPFDWVTGYAPAAGIRSGAVTPPCVVPADGPSTIGARDVGGPREPVVRSLTRRCASRVWLEARRLGFATTSYARRF